MKVSTSLLKIPVRLIQMNTTVLSKKTKKQSYQNGKPSSKSKTTDSPSSSMTLEQPKNLLPLLCPVQLPKECKTLKTSYTSIYL